MIPVDSESSNYHTYSETVLSPDSCKDSMQLTGHDLEYINVG